MLSIGYCDQTDLHRLTSPKYLLLNLVYVTTVNLASSKGCRCYVRLDFVRQFELNQKRVELSQNELSKKELSNVTPTSVPSMFVLTFFNSSSFGCCYLSVVNIIDLTLSQRDHIKPIPLYLKCILATLLKIFSKKIFSFTSFAKNNLFLQLHFPILYFGGGRFDFDWHSSRSRTR